MSVRRIAPAGHRECVPESIGIVLTVIRKPTHCPCNACSAGAAWRCRARSSSMGSSSPKRRNCSHIFTCLYRRMAYIGILCVTEREPQPGRNTECFPAPPATRILRSSARRTGGTSASGSSRSTQRGQRFRCVSVPYIPPTCNKRTGWRACS